VIENAATEPEILDLIMMLQNMGAIIELGTDRVIAIDGVERLKGGRHEILPDRMEAASYACMALATGGRIFCRNARQEHMITFLNAVRRLGADYEVVEGGIVFFAPGQHPRQQDVLRRPHAGVRQPDPRTPQPARRLGEEGVRALLDAGAHGPQRVEVEIHGPGADPVAPDDRQDRPPHAVQQRRQGEDRDPVGPRQAEGVVPPERGRVQRQRVALHRDLAAEALAQLLDDVDLLDPREMMERHRLLGQERGHHHLRGRVLRPRDDHLALDPLSTRDPQLHTSRDTRPDPGRASLSGRARPSRP
jgi:hypothetical protein